MTPARRRPARLAAVAALALLFSLVAPSASLAAGEPVGVTFSPANKTIEYGDYWEVTASLTNLECLDGCDDTFNFIVQDPTTGESINSPVFDNSVFVSSFDFSLLFPPGEYEITGAMDDEDLHPMDPGNEPGTLTIAPAALDVEATVIADPLQPAGAIVSAQLTGAYVSAIDECFGSTECHPQLPSGTWQLTMRNDAGEVIHEEKISTKAKASRYVSFYWHGITPETNYTVDASFAPVADQAGNFSLKPALGTSYTSEAAPESGDADAPATPEVEVEEAAAPTLPFWLVVLAIVLVVLLAAAVITFWTLLRRRRAAADPDAVTVDEGGAL